MQHLILYDGDCPLCQRAIRFILAHDKSEQFAFAPLNGKTAAQFNLSQVPKRETVILIEDFQGKSQILIEGRASLRILWHLKGWWRLFGSLSFLPPLPFNLIYRVIARYRYRIFKKKLSINKDSFSNRFLL